MRHNDSHIGYRTILNSVSSPASVRKPSRSNKNPAIKSNHIRAVELAVAASEAIAISAILGETQHSETAIEFALRLRRARHENSQDVFHHSQQERNIRKSIRKPFVAETSFLSESADFEEVKKCKSAKSEEGQNFASQTSVHFERSDPLCSLIPCSIEGAEMSDTSVPMVRNLTRRRVGFQS